MSIRDNSNPKWQGIDENHAVSLFNHGLLINKIRAKDEYIVLYKLAKNKFMTSRLNNRDLTALVCDYEWLTLIERADFFNSVNVKNVDDMEVWRRNPVIDKLNDLIKHFGYETILGRPYWFLTAKQALRAYRENNEYLY